RKRRRASEVAAEAADVLGSTDDDGAQRADAARSYRQAHLPVDDVDERRSVLAAARGEDLVDAVQAVQIAVQAVEQQRVERLAQEEGGSGECAAARALDGQRLVARRGVH